jgi:hypothetical protein
MSEIKKHFFKVPENIKEMTDVEFNDFIQDLWAQMTTALKEDKNVKKD